MVQLYAADPVAQVTRPVRWLLGFAKVELDPGEQAEVRFDVHTDRLAFTGLDGRRIVEPGEIHLYAGPSSADTPAHAVVELTGGVRTAEVLRRHRVPVTVGRARPV
ncbi:fibronectin type III-like domain-contianing protein [Thermocatellispora tengchongensis]|uniref:fibronectin type III-like domain-contianing protein n=1 Tax=Thermocatellispora tengchongensis TaxID=1073253 RepID=UPI003633C04D